MVQLAVGLGFGAALCLGVKLCNAVEQVGVKLCTAVVQVGDSTLEVADAVERIWSGPRNAHSNLPPRQKRAVAPA